MENMQKECMAQFTLCGSQGKRLIAQCIMGSGVLRPYRQSGRIILKGSSTVSCLTNLLCAEKMRLCGRISPRGMKGAASGSDGAHMLLYRGGTAENIDSRLDEILPTLRAEDLFITGANAIDSFGHAALLFGADGGGAYGKCMPFLQTSGVKVMILTSASKLIPGNLKKLIPRIDRERCSVSYGMSCGLLPIEGTIITEVEALQMFAQVKAAVFASGGHTGAENSTAIQIQGTQNEVKNVLELVKKIKEAPEEEWMTPGSEKECAYPCSGCAKHRGCIYAHKCKGFETVL